MALLSRILGLFLLLAGSTLAHNGPQYIPRPYLLGVSPPSSPTAVNSSLLLISASTGDYKQIGSAPYQPLGESSALSYCQDLMFIVGWNPTQQTTALLGFNTTTGDLIHEIKLPFFQPSNKNHAAPAGVARSGRQKYFVFGMEHEKGPLVAGIVNLKTQALENKVVITQDTSSLSFERSNDSVATNFGGNLVLGVQGHHKKRFFSVNMEKSSVKEFGTGDFINIVDLHIYMERGIMLGIGILPTESGNTRNISVVELTRNLEFEAKYSLELYDGSGDIGPLGIEWNAEFMYWIQHGFLSFADMHLQQNQKVARLPKISNMVLLPKYSPWCPP